MYKCLLKICDKEQIKLINIVYAGSVELYYYSSVSSIHFSKISSCIPSKNLDGLNRVGDV